MSYENQQDSELFTDLARPTDSEVSEEEPKKLEPDNDQPRFTKRQDLNLDEKFEYQRNGSDPGTVLIFNQVTFDEWKATSNEDECRERKGSWRDVYEITRCFRRLGFNVYEKNIKTDLSAAEIKEKIDSVVNDTEALKKTNCLIVFFLSHGWSNERVYTRDLKLISTGQIWGKFAKSEELKHKPKMFVFQACKGCYITTTSGQPNVPGHDPTKMINLDNFSANQLGDDMLVVYATTEGHAAFRDELMGTWLIQELCKTFSSYGRRDDVISMITRIIKCVCADYFNEPIIRKPGTPKIQKQMPMFVSTLSKKFYLNTNKEYRDRHALINIQKETEDIHELVSELANVIKPDVTGFIMDSRSQETAASGRAFSSSSVRPTAEQLISPRMSDDEASHSAPETTRKIGAAKRKHDEIETVVGISKQICQTVSAPKEAARPNAPFGEYVAARLNEMSPEEAREKRKQMLLTLEQ